MARHDELEPGSLENTGTFTMHSKCHKSTWSGLVLRMHKLELLSSKNEGSKHFTDEGIVISDMSKDQLHCGLRMNKPKLLSSKNEGNKHLLDDQLH